MIFNDSSLMPYGIHKGKALINVPAHYLLWLYDNKKYNRELRVYIEDNIEVLREQVKQKEKQKS